MLVKILFFVACAIFGTQAALLNPCRGVDEEKKVVANPRGCAWYFICEDIDNPIEQRCPYDLHFNIQTQSCSYPDVVYPRCTFDEDLIARTYFECPSNKDMRIIPHPFDCRNYTLCWQGENRSIKCPDDRPHFSIYDMDCTTEALAECKSVDRFCDGRDQTQFIENPLRCDDYVLCTECQNKLDILNLICPHGFKYNKETKICVEESTFECHAKEIKNDADVPPEPHWIDCPYNSSFHVPHPNDCRYFFYCFQSGSVLEKCLGDELFDTKEEDCVEASIANCYPGSFSSTVITTVTDISSTDATSTDPTGDTTTDNEIST